jgi:hypothetical protein
MGASNEIAAIMNYENTTQSQAKVRHMMVIKRDGRTQRVSTISRLWEPLAYPLFFPHGTLGWGVRGSSELDNTVDHNDLTSDVPTRQIMHYRACILSVSYTPPRILMDSIRSPDTPDGVLMES